ncbi:lysophospholipid transporter LplT [Sulfuriferula nivalis]|uniref:Lysophospholipid transporter LplT n=1 Tax=Sulfuriferula nivalis TaxID=2675298 RepID=A0A809SID2_9PROT|nr:lysophospholipid transporter LplT [Sulfuriferula nivalis]BBP01700.1 lysophospholipid transporter LplT [Sulfuriferula nivalis]
MANLNLELKSRPMFALLTAQFLSALADNALLIALIASMKSAGQAQHISWLQIGFVVPFIVLAPFVGALADAYPKGRVMLVGNTVKLVGTLLVVAQVSPVVSYVIVGIGATLYSPAKYGILTQFFHVDKLVRANSWLEGSTIAAILLGVVLGGWLADQSVRLALLSVVGIYVLAAVLNLFIPKIVAEHEMQQWRMHKLITEFLNSLMKLIKDPQALVSLLGTSLFWGSGATLRLMLFIWVPLALGIMDNQTPANLMGVLSIGIVIGAIIAAKFVTLDNVNKVFVVGLFIGPIIMLLSLQHAIYGVALLLVLLGVAGGLFVVPLNALLQQRGHVTVGAGHALAIQNLFENITMLVLVSGYSGIANYSVTADMFVLGLLMLVCITGLMLKIRRQC